MFDLGPLPLFLVALVVVGGVAWWQHQRNLARREGLLLAATRYGLSFSIRDPFGTLAHPFALFREGDRQSIGNVVHGRLGDDEVRVFELRVVHEHRDQDGTTSESTSWFTCAVLPLAGLALPHLEISPESVLTRLKGAVGFDDIQFESDDFNRRWHVRSADRRFAYTVLDARMMRWLMDVPDGHRFEVRGQLVLAARPGRLEPDGMLVAHHMLADLRSRIPSVTRELYGPGRT